MHRPPYGSAPHTATTATSARPLPQLPSQSQQPSRSLYGHQTPHSQLRLQQPQQQNLTPHHQDLQNAYGHQNGSQQRQNGFSSSGPRPIQQGNHAHIPQAGGLGTPTSVTQAQPSQLSPRPPGPFSGPRPSIPSTTSSRPPASPFAPRPPRPFQSPAFSPVSSHPQTPAQDDISRMSPASLSQQAHLVRTPGGVTSGVMGRSAAENPASPISLPAPLTGRPMNPVRPPYRRPTAPGLPSSPAVGPIRPPLHSGNPTAAFSPPPQNFIPSPAIPSHGKPLQSHQDQAAFDARSVSQIPPQGYLMRPADQPAPLETTRGGLQQPPQNAQQNWPMGSHNPGLSGAGSAPPLKTGPPISDQMRPPPMANTQREFGAGSYLPKYDVPQGPHQSQYDAVRTRVGDVGPPGPLGSQPGQYAAPTHSENWQGRQATPHHLSNNMMTLNPSTASMMPDGSVAGGGFHGPAYTNQVNQLGQQLGAMGLNSQRRHAQPVSLADFRPPPLGIQGPTTLFSGISNVCTPLENFLPPDTAAAAAIRDSGGALANAQYNCPPIYQRITINAIPKTQAMLNKSKIPLGLIIAPFKTPAPELPQIPIIHPRVILRCRRCRTYINPFVEIESGNKRWKCNLCYLWNEFPENYDWDEALGRHVILSSKPEFYNAAIEFSAPPEYMVRLPQPPVYLFVIDVSFNAVKSGMLGTASQTILQGLDSLPNYQEKTRVGIICVDSCLHFFSFKSGQEEPSMYVVADLEDVFLPQPDDLLVEVTHAKDKMKSLFGKLESFFADTHDVTHALGPALKAALELIGPIGGKVCVLSATIPNAHEGQLKMREDIMSPTPQKETLLQPASYYYKQLSVDCSRAQVGVDFFLFGVGYSDVATLCCAPRFTGASTFYYAQFDGARQEDKRRFATEFAHYLRRDLAFEAVMRVRASRGIRMNGFYGNFFVRSSDLLALPNVNPENTYAMEFTYDESLESNVVCFQTALLHTASTGERRIRVLTTSAPVANSIVEVFQGVDAEGLMNLLCRKAMEKASSSKLEDARDALVNKLVDLISVYRSEIGSSPSSLVLPSNLVHYPVMTLGLLKNLSLRQGATISSDLRSWLMECLRVLPVELTSVHCYPMLFGLHETSFEWGHKTGEGSPGIPPLLRASSEEMTRDGMFLLFVGHMMMLWISRDVSPQLLYDVFEVSNYDEVHAGKGMLPLLASEHSTRVNNVVGEIRERCLLHSCLYPPLYVVKELDPPQSAHLTASDMTNPALRHLFLSYLIEDRLDGVNSYPQFLNSLGEKLRQ